MKTVSVALALFGSLALAAPASVVVRGGDGVCSGTLYSVPQCCSTDVLGILGLDCETRKSLPTKYTKKMFITYHLWHGYLGPSLLISCINILTIK